MADVKKKSSATKKRKNNTNKVLIGVLVGVVLLALFVTLSLTVFFNVSAIGTSGSKLYTTEEIVAASGIKVGDNLWLMNEAEAGARIAKTLPYIVSVKLEKQFPDKLIIVVTETKEYLTVSVKGKYYTANAEGKILDEVNTPSDKLILLTVSDKTSTVLGETITFETEREKELFGSFVKLSQKPEFDVNLINMAEPFDTYIKLDGRIVVKFGSSSYFEEKTNYLKAGLTEISKDSKGIFDLSTWSPENNKPIFSHVDTSKYTF